MNKIKSIILLLLFIGSYIVVFFGIVGEVISLILMIIFIVFLFIPFGGNIIDSTKNLNEIIKENKMKKEENFFPNKKNKIAIMLSGGVDSAVVVKLLLEKKYEVEAFFMRNWDSTTNFELNKILTKDEICQQEEDYKDAVSVAKHFNIKLHRIDFVKEYWDDVFSVFLKEIERGLTPNPDILCNRHIKFGRFIQYIEDKHPQFNFIATGHYAKIIERDGIKLLSQAKDSLKDQTYFLAEIERRMINKIVFPLGDLEKSEIREIAKESKIPVATKKDSTGICFIGKRNFPEFISNYLEKKPGKIIDEESGEVVGKHNGALFYTIGQRKGLNLGGFDKPYFVSSKDIKKNQIFVSSGIENKNLFSKEIYANNFNFLVDESLLDRETTIKFKTRHSETIYKGKLILIGDSKVKVIAKEKVKAVTPGQELVVYLNRICIGGGQII